MLGFITRRRRRTAVAFTVAGLAALAVAAALAWGDAFGSPFRISFQGHDGDTTYQSQFTDVAYDPQTDQHLVVFETQDPNGITVMGQLIDASGNLVGSNFPISSGSANPDDSFEPPNVSYDETDNQFLVTWYNYQDAGKTGQVFAQRVSATGALLGTNEVVSSESHDDIETTDSAWSPDGNEFLVIWKDVSQPGQVFARRLGPDGTPLDASQTQLTSFPSGAGRGADDATGVAYNSRDHQFLVVVRGVDQTQAGSEDEIWGQRVGLDGLPTGAADFRISQAPPGTTTSAIPPQVAYDSTTDQYLVAFTRPLQKGHPQSEVFAQRVGADGSLVGSTFQVSSLGVSSERPDIVYDVDADQYLVVFQAGANQNATARGGPPTFDNSPTGIKVYGDVITGGGDLTGTRDFLIGDTPSSDYGAARPADDYNSQTCDYVAAWYADTNSGSLVQGQYEIWGRRVSAPACPPPQATTDPATGVTQTTGTLNGTVNPARRTATYHFDWGTTTAYGSTTAAQAAGSDSSDHPESAGLTGLRPGTTYHFRIVATNSAGTATGADQVFTTPVASRRAARGRIALSGVPTVACTRAGRLTLRVRVHSASRVRSVSVRLDGRRIASARRGTLTVHIHASRLSRRRHRLTVTTVNAGGISRRTISFRRCAAVRARFTG